MNSPTRVADAVLVVVDISGYTRFVQQRTVSLQHAEAIVTELIEAIIDQASHPLMVNKLEGDAALLYAESGGDRRAAVRSAMWQVAQFFHSFAACIARIKEARRHCSCDACANVGSLQLKAFLHIGEVVIKRVRQFEEIAGDAVILVHRLMKNTLPLHEYVLMTDTFRSAGGGAIERLMPHAETIDGASLQLYWCTIDALSACADAMSVPAAALQRPAHDIAPQRVCAFHNLPSIGESTWRALLSRLLKWPARAPRS